MILSSFEVNKFNWEEKLSYAKNEMKNHKGNFYDSSNVIYSR